MTRISQTMIGAMLFGALAAPAMAQQNGNGMQPSTTQSGEVRGDQPAGQMAGDQAASDPAVPGQTPGRVEGRTSGTMKDRATSREAPGAMGATTPPDSRTVAKASGNSSSRVAPFASRSRNSTVLALSCSSLSEASEASSAPMRLTSFEYPPITR